MTPLLNIILGGFLAFCGGAAVAYLTFRLNRDRSQIEHLRLKLEELYLATDAFEKKVSENMIGYLPVVDGKITWNQMLDIQIEKGGEVAFGGRGTMEMLISIYFPELLDPFDGMIAKLGNFNSLVSLMKAEYTETGTLSRDVWNSKITFNIAEYSDAAIALRKSIIESARPLSGLNIEKG